MVAMAVMAAALGASMPAVAGDLGSWTITGSVRAPWAMPGSMQDDAEIRRLVGKHVRFAQDAIVGPRPLACRGPRYERKTYSTDMLFQGTLSDPDRQATTLGFTNPTVPTLETGCDGPLDFHFINDRVAMFGLNNRVYTIRRDR